jgi:hypothetical protein
MRHFHDTLIGKHSFFTVSYEGGLSGTDPDSVLAKDSILGVLADCLEVDFVDVVGQVVKPADEYESERLAPNEVRAINEFMDFYPAVQLALRGPAPQLVKVGDAEVSIQLIDTFKGVWLYTNLNEGKSVAWSVFLEE